MDGDGITSVVVYGLCLILVVLLVWVVRNDKADRYPMPEFPLAEWHVMVILSWIALWLLIGSLVFAAGVDVLIWAMKSQDPSVSNLVHYYLQLYPFIGWIAAGLVYHLLVDRPAPPWR